MKTLEHGTCYGSRWSVATVADLRSHEASVKESTPSDGKSNVVCSVVGRVGFRPLPLRRSGIGAFCRNSPFGSLLLPKCFAVMRSDVRVSALGEYGLAAWAVKSPMLWR